MRNCFGRLKKTCFILPGCLFLLLGCTAPSHTNTLMFGTNTKFAIDVSADPSGTPSVTVGYKRQEAVWMPLLANKDADGGPADCQTEGCRFIGSQDSEKDTYSVLASFGAKFAGTGDQAGARAEGGLAQYFATGLAARILAREGGARLVAVQPADSELYEEQKKKGESRGRSRIVKKKEILSNVAPDGALDANKWSALVEKTDLEDTVKTSLKALKDFEAVNRRLDLDAGMNGKIIDALYQKLELKT